MIHEDQLDDRERIDDLEQGQAEGSPEEPDPTGTDEAGDIYTDPEENE